MRATRKTGLAEAALDLVIALPAVLIEYVISAHPVFGRSTATNVVASEVLSILGEAIFGVALLFLVWAVHRLLPGGWARRARRSW